MTIHVGIVGGGEFGRGLAKAAERAGNPVTVWSRRPAKSETKETRETADPAVLADCGLIFLAVPSPYVAEVAGKLGRHLDGRHLVVHVSRGLVGPELQPITTVLREVTPCRRLGALAGPLVAESLANGTPGGGVVGTRFPEVTDAVRRAIASPGLLIYETSDVHGVELASAMVGLLAIGLGYARGFGIGPAALAVLATRGIAEAWRLGEALGGNRATFVGLAGFGDLVAAVAGDDRPEFRLGRALAEGLSRAEAAERVGVHIESVPLARRLADYSARTRLDTPIIQTIAEAIDGRLDVAQATSRLMARRVGRE